MAEIESVLRRRVIDNRHVSMVDAFRQVLPLSKNIDIAVGYFFISGFKSIENEIEEFINKGGTIRILMGNVTDILTGETIDKGYQLRSKELLLDEIENLEVTTKNEAIINNLRKWIANRSLTVKIYTGNANYFHAKSYLFYRQNREELDDGIAIVGSSNFTRSGFQGNTELNSLSQDNFGALSEWFHEIWEGEDVSDFSKELLAYIDQAIPQKQSPVYMHPKETYLMFSRYFAKRLPEDIQGDFMETLYRHQRIGVAELKYRLDQFGTAVLADGVGLGKTRTSAATLRAIDAQSTLIIASRKLHDQWRYEMDEVGISQSYYQLVSKEEIARLTPQNMTEFMKSDFIIVDEAHQGLKNDRTNLYRNLSYLKDKKNGKLKGLLLTATPWNNSRSDVFNLGRLFLRIENIPTETPYYQYLYQSPRKAARMIEQDDIAFHYFWRDLFLQRTKNTYGGQDVQYAERKFPVAEINYEPQKEKAFAANGERINRLYLPYMNPIRYTKGENEVEFTADRMKILFLKRADSSWNAFKDTLLKIENRLTTMRKDLNVLKYKEHTLIEFKSWLKKYYDLSINANYDDLFENMEEDELTEALKMEQLSLQKSDQYRIRLDNRINGITDAMAQNMISTMVKHANQDLEIIYQIIDELDEAFQRKDEKYEKVRDSVKKYMEQGEKVLLISQFRSTVIDYYNKFKADEYINNFRLAQVTGSSDDWYIDEQKQESKEEILERFAPKAKNKPEIIKSDKEIQLIIGTETLSVGQNLQDCRVIMNLDLPYNPMNLEQRIGRIDRPQESIDNRTIEIVTFPSMPIIESELKLSNRLRSKLEGIYQDTKFDNLVLPEYRDFLNEVLKERKVTQKNMSNMVEESSKTQVLKTNTEEHSVKYREAQKRMRQAIEEGVLFNKKAVFNNYSFTTTGSNDVIMKVTLRDINNIKIDDYLIYITQKDNCVSNKLVDVEESWYEATNYPVLSKKQLPIEEAKKILMHKNEDLKNIILKNEVDKYNEKLNVTDKMEERFIESKAKKIIAEIFESIRGKNQKLISSKIKIAGYSPKSIQNLINSIKYVDSNYDEEEMKYINELYENIELLWKNYKFYYKIFVKDRQLFIDNSLNYTLRKANLDNSTIEVIVGNISI